MKLLSSVLLIGAMFTAATTPAATTLPIRWLEKDHDFGLIHEVAGPQTGHSRFVNIGSEPVSIIEVRPSCGCTSAEFTQEPIAPGDTAVISYTYDPTRRPGKFFKSVRVKFDDNSREQIIIEGNVLGTPESLASLYPVDAGAMRLTDSVINIGEITYGRSPVRFINGYILAQDTIRPLMSTESKAVAITASEPQAGPGDLITYSIHFNAAKDNLYGPVAIPLSFRARPEDNPTIITLRAEVIPDRQALQSSQGSKHPALALTDNTISLGEFASSDSPEIEIELRNTGNAPLQIYRIYDKNEHISIKNLPSQIKAGKKHVITLNTNLSGLPAGATRIPVAILSNDPMQPRQVINIVLTIKQ